MQNIDKVFYLGPDGSYTQLAQQKFARLFGFEDIETRGMKNIKSVLNNFENDENSIAVIPIENAIEGFVRESLDGIKNFQNPDLTIFASTQIPIKHCLVSNSDKMIDIKTIVSHPQALAQCQNTITSLFSYEVEFLPYSSTSGSAVFIKDKGINYASITNLQTAKLMMKKVMLQDFLC